MSVLGGGNVVVAGALVFTVIVGPVSSLAVGVLPTAAAEGEADELDMAGEVEVRIRMATCARKSSPLKRKERQGLTEAKIQCKKQRNITNERLR